MFKNRSYPFIFLLSCSLLCSLQADDFSGNHLFFDTDDELNSLIDDEFDSEIVMPTREKTPAQAASLLVDLCTIPLLQEDLFLKTHPLKNRSLLDLPTFLPQHFHCDKWTIGASLFFNQTSRMYFARESSSICSYLAIKSPEVLKKLEKVLTQVSELFPNVPMSVLNYPTLFENATVSERRTGLMFHLIRQWDRVRFRSITPLYYMERNYFLTKEEQEAIEKELGRSSQDDTDRFAYNHLVSDKFGIGDTRFNVDVTAYESDNFRLNAGALITLPTAKTFVHGLLGAQLEKKTCKPELDILNLFTLACGDREDQAKAVQMSQDFALQSLNALSALLLDEELGNRGHLGIGGYLETKTALRNWLKIPWAENFYFYNRTSFEYLAPSTELRCFVECDDSQRYKKLKLNRDPQEISDDLTDDDDYAKAVLDFIEQQFIDTVIPYARNARVHPKFIGHYTGKFLYETDCKGFFIGSDWWVQSTEKIESIKPRLTKKPNKITLNPCKSQLCRAYEGKVIGGAFWRVKRDNREWTLSLQGDTSTWNSGIGDNFTVSFNIETIF